jgi:hypothetical protein
MAGVSSIVILLNCFILNEKTIVFGDIVYLVRENPEPSNDNSGHTEYS